MALALQEEVHQLHSRLCQGVADPKRILILYALDGCPQNVTELAQELAMPQSTTSRHLRQLRERGLVIPERRGHAVYYAVADPRIIEALDLMRAVLAEQLETRATLVQSLVGRSAEA